jgi:hypothetical protein
LITNPLIAERKLGIEFKKPWDYLLKMPLSARSAEQSTARRAENLEMWSILDEVRTHFEQNPD